MALLKALTNTLLQAYQACISNENQKLSGLDSRKYNFERIQQLKLNVFFPFGGAKCIVVFHIYTHFFIACQN